MTENAWKRRPSREAHSRTGVPRARRALAGAARIFELNVSTATVKTHINNLFAKTGLKDRAQAVRYAYGKGLVRPPGGRVT